MRGLLFLLSLMLVACSPPSVENYHTGENEEEIISLLNRRQYEKAVWLMESREGKSPANPRSAFLLAQAYLGKAGFEPLAFAAKVSASQDPSLPKARDLFPVCPEGPIRSVGGFPLKCFLKRVYVHAPDPDTPEFSRARELFRRAYPNAATSPEWVNTLIGIVETVSLAGRAGNLYLYAKKIDQEGAKKFNPFDIPWIKSQANGGLREAREALDRAEFAGSKVSKLLTGVKEEIWFTRAEGGIRFAEALGLARLLDFIRARLLKPENEIQYGETLDALREMLEEEERTLNPN